MQPALPRRPVWWAPACALLISAFLVLAFLGVRGQDPTTDETSYFGLGKHLLLTRDWSTRRAILHPPLSAYVNSLPLLAGPGAFAVRTDPEPWPLLSSRLVSLLVFGVPLLIVVALWARDLFGYEASLVAMALAAFSPTLLAHAPLITPDVPLAATGLAALYAFRRARGPWGAVGWGALLGLALLAKASGWLFAAVILAIGAVRVARGGGRRAIGEILPGLLAALVVVNLAYGFQGLLEREAKELLLAKVPSMGQRLLGWAAAPWFPLPYLRSMGAQLAVSHRGWNAYLWGRVSHGGWWYYFLAALVVKETVPSLLLLGGAVGAWWRRRLPLLEELCLALPPLLFIGAFSVVGNVQIGVRYVLPALPFLYVFAARAWSPSLPRVARAAVCALLGWHALAAVRISPDFLAYFNELVGGPARGYLFLGDSNLDWGQNRGRAREYARRQGVPLEPEALPEHGRVVVSASRLQGIIDRSPYRRLRDEYAPVGHVGYNWLVYDMDRPRFPPGSVLSFSSGPGWNTTAGDTEGPAASWTGAPLADAAADFVPGREYPGTDARLMTCPPPGVSCTFRRTFDLPGPPQQAVLHLAAREAWQLEVNGVRVAGTEVCAHGFVKTEQRLEERLRAGPNTVVLRMRSCSAAPVAGAMAELRVVARRR